MPDRSTATPAVTCHEDTGRASILVVDDDDSKLLALQTLLEDLGQVVCAGSGREALRALLNRNFALILLDINMPGMDGFETAQLIRQRRTNEETPIIFVTAYGEEVLMQRSYSLGAVDYILSPIVPEILRTKVSVFTSLYNQTEHIRRQARRLEQRTAQLSNLANQLTEAEHRERRRLARVLHDHLQQLLAAAKMRVSAIGVQDGAPGVLKAVKATGEILDEAIGVSRSLTVELVPPVLHDGGLRQALDWLARRFEKDHGLAVHLECGDGDDSLPDHLLNFFYHAVRELLFNVVKHAGVDEARVRFEREADVVRVSVEDSGAGFRAEAIEEASNGTEHFGLFSIRERLRYLDGDLEIESREGRGARFTLISPVAAPTPAPATVRESSTGVPAPRRERPDTGDATTVLLADDHRLLRRGLAGLLEAHADIRVIGEADNGEQAVAMASDLRPDVVIMDVSMPGIGGVEATRRIVAALPAVRVIGLSMHDRSEVARRLAEAGAVGYLHKAGPAEELLGLIRARSVAARE